VATTRMTLDDRLRAALAKAVWAPSAHNTQPWRFRVAGHSTVHLLADRTRALAVNDPYDRELTVSCGAALCTFEVAAASGGWRTEVATFPDPSEPELLATVEGAERSGESAMGSSDAGVAAPDAGAAAPDAGAAAPDAGAAAHVGAPVAGAADTPAGETGLAAAIVTRHTYRGRFADAPLPEGLAGRLVAAAERDGVALVNLATPDARADLAAVVADADRTQFGDPKWRRELAMWMHPGREVDGMPLPRGSDLGTRLAPTAPGEPITVDDPDRSLVLDAPLVVVLATVGDRQEDWLGAGRVLQRVLLTAASEGVQASYLNQACQVTEARRGVRYLIGGELHPQAILRFGVPATRIRRTTRRPLEDILEGA
jgi:hypothetical protein